MANFDDQLLRAWDEWEETTGEASNDPDEFIVWAVENKRLVPRPQDLYQRPDGLTHAGFPY